MRTRRILLLLLALVELGGCGARDLPPPVVVPEFERGDAIRCSTGGGDGLYDRLVFTAEGRLTYTPIAGPAREKLLTSERTLSLYYELVEAGLLEIKEVPNREMEHFGVVLEAELGDRAIRGSIGLLEMNKEKHHPWREILKILSKEIEFSR